MADRNPDPSAHKKWARLVSNCYQRFLPWWEPLPERWRKAVLWPLKTVFIIGFFFVCLILFSILRPNVPLAFSYEDFRLESKAAKTNAFEAAEAARQAAQSLARIEAVERTVNGQRATIDASFRNAEDANRMAGQATQTLAAAEQSLRQMKKDAEFIDLVARSIGGFADAYDVLRAMPANDPNFPKAYNAWLFIEEFHALWHEKFHKAAVLAPGFGLQETNVTIPEVRNAFARMTLAQQLTTVYFVKEESRFSTDEKLSFLYSEAVSNANLRVRSAASQGYMDLAGIRDVNNPLGGMMLVHAHFLTNTAAKTTNSIK